MSRIPIRSGRSLDATSSAKPRRVSLVVPVYNEAESVVRLWEEVKDSPVAEELLEAIFVDDGSTDGTAAAVKALAEQDSRVRLIRFSRNFGKAAAYGAAFEQARGEVIATLDGDLQDDPRGLERMLERLDAGADLVVGWKQNRLENEPEKALPSRVYNGIKQWLFGLRLHDSNCGIRVMRREVASSLLLYGDRHRFIPELAHLRGYRVTEARVRHRPRQFGRSKYSAGRFWTGLLDLLSVRFLTGFGTKPLHFFGTVGLVPLVLGVGLLLYVLAMKLSGSLFQTHVAAIIVGALLVMVGIQLLATGLVCEMLAHESGRERWQVRERVGFDSDDD